MKSVRNMKLSTESGTDVKQTDQLKGEAKQTKAWNAKNSTEQYTTGSTEKGSLGGTNTNS